MRANRWASASSWRVACSMRTAAGAAHAGRDLAVQRRGPLPARARRSPRAARPELLGRRAAMMTDAEGHYQFTTIKPGAYPWRNHHNAWRPAHIHFSLFGPSFQSRLVTQMYFPNDPLFAVRPDHAVGARRARARAAGVDVRSGADATGVGARLPVRYRACGGGTRRRLRGERRDGVQAGNS